MKRPLPFNWKLGAVTGALFAVGGFVIVLPDFADWDFAIFPGAVLTHCLSMLGLIEMHGGCSIPVCVIFANAIMYGFAGFLIGAFVKSRKFVFSAMAAFVVFLLFGYCSLHVGREIRQWQVNRLTARHKQDAIMILKEDPNDIYSLYWMGVYHFRNRQYKEAEEYFRKILDIESDMVCYSLKGQLSLMYLAVMYQSWGQYEKAGQFYQKAIAVDADLYKDLMLFELNRIYTENRPQSTSSPSGRKEPNKVNL